MNSRAHFGSSPLGQSLPSLRPSCRACSVLLMDHDDAQRALAQLWRQARDGSLTPWSQAKAWALREVWKETHGDKTYGLLSHVASRLKKQGGGKPSTSAVSQLYEKMDSDADWFPGKFYGSLGGRPCEISETNKSVIARSMMAFKENGGEPTYSMAIAQCPAATLNPSTKKPVGKKRVYDVFTTKCHDGDESRPWALRPRLSKHVLTEEDVKLRFEWAKYMKGLRHTVQWYVTNIVWTDICNSILRRSPKKAQLQAFARKAGKGWMSEGSQKKATNMRGPKAALKQNSWDCIRVWWCPVLTRNKLHVEILGTDFPGDVPEGMHLLVAKVRAAINIRFQDNDKPDVLFVDRGKGFFNPRTAQVTPQFKDAAATHGFRIFMRDNARLQPGNLQEAMLHETAVGWMRKRLAVTVPANPWLETVEEYSARLKSCCAYINSNHDVAGLADDLLERVDKLVAAKGGRLDE